MQVIPILEMFNTFNNKNNINPLSTPALFDFSGFLHAGVGIRGRRSSPSRSCSKRL